MARNTALLTLYKIEYEGAYSNIELKNMLAASELSKKDKALATALVYGVLQRDYTLECIISEFSSVKIKKISKYILLILKLGIYQLLYMDKIPESAAVNESVKLAKKYGAKSTGFVNAVLRNISRKGISEPKDRLLQIAFDYSFPKELAKEWIDEFGEKDACGLMSAMNEIAPMCVRVNTLKANADELLMTLPGAKKGKISKCALITDGFDVAQSNEYNQGLITVQDEAAMLACEILEPKPGECIMDLCAAPGGKSTYIAQLMNNSGKVLSFDIHKHKIKLIEENAERLGIDIISAAVGDACVFDEKYKECADRIIADVPCSGLGIIRKKPELKMHYKKNNNLSEIQYTILANAGRYLKPGGVLVYSTCTIERCENEDVVEKFLKDNDDFEAVNIEKYLPKETAKKGYVTLYPNIDGKDGFFMAKLKKVR